MSRRYSTLFLAVFTFVFLMLSGANSIPLAPDSPVNASQTRVGMRGPSPAVVPGFVVHQYTLENAPVFRERYPLNLLTPVDLIIPENRALRINNTAEGFATGEFGVPCLPAGHNVTVKGNFNRTAMLRNLYYPDANGVEKRFTGYYRTSLSIYRFFNLTVHTNTAGATIRTSVVIYGTISDNANCKVFVKNMTATIVECNGCSAGAPSPPPMTVGPSGRPRPSTTTGPVGGGFAAVATWLLVAPLALVGGVLSNLY